MQALWHASWSLPSQLPRSSVWTHLVFYPRSSTACAKGPQHRTPVSSDSMAGPIVQTSRPWGPTPPPQDRSRAACNLSLAFHSLTHFVPKPKNPEIKPACHHWPTHALPTRYLESCPWGPTGPLQGLSLDPPSNGSEAQLWSTWGGPFPRTP